jgi:hypothetical protein
MTSFKISKKPIHTDSRTSILEKHEKKIKEIESKKEKIKIYKQEIETLKLCDTSLNLQKIKILNEKIKEIESNDELAEYLFKAIDFIKDLDSAEQQLTKNENENENENYNDNENENSGDISRYIHLNSKNNKELLYKNYIIKCFPEEGIGYINPISYTYKCMECGDKLINDQSVGVNVCYTCGSIENFNISDTREWNHSETHEYNKPYCYKRTNHFKEWISQTQGREGVSIPEEIINGVILEIRKERITDKNYITYDKIKEFLKKLKFNKYYEHIPNIITRITGEKRIIINQVLENQLLKMFNEIQTPFKKHCPASRKNFLSYSYTLYKFFQLLEKNEYLKYFPLLKSRDKMYEQDEIWKNICKELNWKFISSI